MGGTVTASCRLALALGVILLAGMASGADPQVTNLRARQLEDGTRRVEVLYDLAGAPASGATVTVAFSTDGGATYAVTPESSTLFGDVGAGVANGLNRRIVWQAAASMPRQFYSTEMRAAVTATSASLGQVLNLRLTAVTQTSVSLAWDAVADAESYDLWRDGLFHQGTAATTFTDTGLEPDTEYCYTVWARAGAATGPESEEACAVTEAAPGDQTLTVTMTGTGTGTVTSDPPGIDCGATCSFAFPYGTLVTLTASPTGASTFGGWGGNCSGTGTCQVTMDEARNVTATFTGAVGNCGTVTYYLPGDVPLEMVCIPAGTFMMGSPVDERGRVDNEDLHQVTLTQDYYLGVYEVTQGQWEALMGTTPWTDCGNYGLGADYPAYCVSWNMIAGAGGFVDALNTYLGTAAFRLPTEADWERGARAGTQTRFSHGDALECGDSCEACGVHDQYMCWCGNTTGESNPVGSKGANGFGLYDMHGNVWEWVQDWYEGHLGTSPVTDPTGPGSGSSRVFRGGGFGSTAQNCRSANRYNDVPDARYSSLGFRLARSE